MSEAPLTRRATPWLLLLAAALAMALRAPVYLSQPSFWAEEGKRYFAFAWAHPLGEALRFRPVGYLLLWANVATATAAWLVRTGVLSLLYAPQVTVAFALVAQLVPIAVIAWGRAPFWGGSIRRLTGVAICLFGAVTGEIWLNTINSQPWLTLAAALLLLEPAGGTRPRRWLAAGVLAVAGLSAPATSALAPLYLWRAWRVRTRPASVQAAVVVACAAVQVACLWTAMQSGRPLPVRAGGTTLPVFAGTVWMRTLVIPLAGTEAARGFAHVMARRGGLGPLESATLLVAAGVLIGWLARGLRVAERAYLVGAYASVTALTLVSVIGDPARMLRTPWTSSRYVYVPGVLVLLLVLGGVRRDAGRLRTVACGLVLGARLALGMVEYRGTIRWKPYWPRWSAQVRFWSENPAWPLAIWPPKWRMTLAAPPAAGLSAPPRPPAACAPGRCPGRAPSRRTMRPMARRGTRGTRAPR